MGQPVPFVSAKKTYANQCYAKTIYQINPMQNYLSDSLLLLNSSPALTPRGCTCQLTSTIFNAFTIFTTRSLGALRAPTSSLRPFGPLDFVLRAHRALRPVRHACLLPNWQILSPTVCETALTSKFTRNE